MGNATYENRVLAARLLCLRVCDTFVMGSGAGEKADIREGVREN